MQTITLHPHRPLAQAQDAAPLLSLPPLALYIHIPWCVRKCPYCDFNSHEPKGDIPEAAYIQALIRDLELALPLVWGRRVSSIFFGGGTPSLLSAGAVDTLLSAIRARISINPDAEITLEANPGTVEAAKFKDFRAAGVNRISLGIQSFAEDKLQALGRIHNGREAHQAIEIAGRYFDNFNLDLMYALPQQTLAQAAQDVELALAYRPPHLSCYHLTLEPNTAFAHTPPALPDDELSADMQEMIEASLASAAYQHYETSAFCQTGRQSQHNLNYWQFGDYLGIGAGAHSKISLPERILRQMRHKSPSAYLRGVAEDKPIYTQQEVSNLERPFEFMMNALRLTDGVPAPLFAERTGLHLAHLQTAIQQAVQQGLLDVNPAFLRPTLKGQRFLNDLLHLFLPPA